jgi:Ca2+-binding RTX toxin-like protein
MAERIYLEIRSVLGTNYGHMYLVKREVELDEAGNVVANLYLPSDRVIRGSSGFGPTGLSAGEMRLLGSLDDYGQDESPFTRHSVDITNLLGGASKWADLIGYAADINGKFAYELPGGPHLANSNATVLTILARAGIDVRDLDINGNLNGGGPKYVDAIFSAGAAGGDSSSGTLLATGDVTSATALHRDIKILGRDGVADTFLNTSLNETFFGEQLSNGNSIIDTLSYANSESGVNLTLTKDNLGLRLLSSTTGNDAIFGIETVKLTGHDDSLSVTMDLLDQPKTLFDGGSQSGQDTLNFSGKTGAIFLGAASNGFFSTTPAPQAVEIYSGWNQPLDVLQRIWSFLTQAGPGATGLTGPTGLRLTNFEHVVGSSGNDILDLQKLNPGGELTAEQEQAFNDAMAVQVALGNPATVAAAEQARLEQARAIPQNQVNVTIEGGNGNDLIIGTRTGADTIYGGDGVDVIRAGGFTSTIYGGAGNDYLYGGGFGSELYGGDGADVFSLAAHAFVKDAKPEDYAMWGSFVLTGGVQQSWMEDGWAYYAPFSSLVAGAPLGFADLFGALAILLDVPALQTVRYGVTQSDQLVVQFARGRGGQAVIDNYNLDLDTGAATAHIVAFRQIRAHASLDQYKHYLNLALLAGFGGEPAGTDPLVLDLDGDGLELTRPDAANVYFDIDHDGFSERTAWVGGDDGFLARDLNGNGKIDDITELFGDNSTTGFSTLAMLDSNHDGKINAADTDFATLRVWRDLNGDGVTDAGELKTLAETGITEISLAVTTPAHGSVRGNTVTAEATFTRSDGTTSTIADVILQNNQIDSKYLGDTTVSAAAAALMKLKGFGALTDLAVAMTNDATLLGQVTALKARPANAGWATLRADAQAILFRWAGVDGVTATPMGGGTFDTQRLALIEHYMGQQLAPRDGNGQPTDANLAELITTWNDILDKATIRLAVQGPLHATFGDIAYDMANDRFTDPGATALADAYRAAIAQLSSDPAAALADWNANWGPALTAYAVALVRNQGQEILADYEVQSLVHALDGTTPALTLAQLAAGLGITGLMVGTSGNDTLARGSATGLQIYAAGAGNDTITGGGGQDVYVFGRDFGQKDIFEDDFGVNGDRIRFAVYNPDDLTFRHEGDDLVIRVKGSTDKITVHNQYAAPLITLAGQVLTPDHAMEEIQFADGTIFEAGDIAAAIGLGTNGNDVINGTPFSDEIEGLKGDDLLQGGNSGDSYFYSPGDGHDTIHDVMTNPALVGHDTLFLLGGISPQDVHLVRNGDSNDVTMSFGTAGDSITLQDQFVYTALGYGTQLALDNRVDDFFFTGGGGWTWRDLQAATLAAYMTDGNDATYGYGTADEFQITAGNDFLAGFDGGDTYRFGRGAGQDTIYDQQRYPETFISALIGYGWGDDDVLEFSSDVAPGDVTFSRTGAVPDLLITIAGSPDTMTIKNQFVGNVLDIFGLLGMAWFNRVEQFKFADGTVVTWEDVEHIVTTGTAGNDNIYGAFYPDLIDGKAGDDYMSGGDDGDTYLFNLGYGHDTIQDQQVSILNLNPDTVQFGPGITLADVTFTRTGGSNDLQLSFANSTDTLFVKDQFLYFYNIFDTQPGQIEFFKFADGTSIGWEDIIRNLDAAAGTPGDDVIYGFSYQDLLDGGAGDDFISGRSESDTYIFGHGYGHDTIKDNMGSLLATDTDVLRFKDAALADVTFTRNGASDDMQIAINGTSDTVTVQGQFTVLYGLFNFIPDRIERLEFAGGTVLSWQDVIENFDAAAGTDGNDTIYGFSYADTLAGGKGDDFLNGLREDDTYIYSRGDGHDVIVEEADAQTSAFDTLALHGIAPASVSLVRDGNDVTLVFAESAPGAGDAGSILLKDELDDFFSRGVEQITFDGGTVWTQNDLRLMLLAQASTSGNDTIIGFNTNDIIRGGLGNDTMNGGPGDDTFNYARGDGNDVIVEGASGNFSTIDTLNLEGINPAAVSFVRDGNDASLTIAESSPGAGNGGSILLKAQLDNFFSTGVERIVFADGTIWTQNDLRLQALAQASTSGNDTIVGFNTNDILRGGLGNDTITGGPGDDTYIYARGDGNDVIIEAAAGNFSTIDTLNLLGINPADASVVRNGNDISLVITESSPGAGNGGSILLKAELDDFFSTGVEKIVFADGTIWTQNDLRAIALAQSFTSGDDIINGFNTNDTLRGGLGNDQLNGGPGDDTYIYARGDGNDIITEGTTGNFTSFDTLRLQNITPAAVSFVRDVNDLTLVFAETAPGAGNGGSILLKQSLDDYFSQGVERIVFDDGTIWTQADLRSMLLIQATNAGSGTILGFNVADTLVAGLGNRVLNGRGGADTYVYSSAGSNDIIADPGNFLSTLQFSDIASTDVSLSRPAANNGADLVITNTLTGKTVTVQREFKNDGGGGPLLSIHFADGVSWSQAQIQAMLVANNGGFTFTRGDGQVTLDSSVTAVQMAPGIAASDVILQSNGTDLIVKLRGTNDSITVHNDLTIHAWGVSSLLGQLKFSDGTSLDLGQPSAGHGLPLTFTWLGTGNNYFLTGSNYGSNVFDITAGSGIINFGNSSSGGDGTNTVSYLRGDATADVNLNGGTGAIAFGTGIAAQDVYWQANGSGDLIVKIRGDATDQIVVHNDLTNSLGTVTSGLRQLRFNDGSSIDLVQPLSFTWLGTGNNYFLTGSNYGSNVFDITAGSGIINFGNSSSGGDGKNTIKYILGDATADVNLNGGTGTIAFGAGIAAQDVYWQSNSFGDLTVKIRGDATDQIVVHGDLVNQAGTVTSGLRQLQFSDGSSINLTQPLTFTWLGTGNNYFLTGSNYGSNVFDITAGSGIINFGNSGNGGDGKNTIKYRLGDATADVNLNGGTGTIAFGAGIAAQDVYWQSNSFGDLTVKIRGDATDQIVVHGDLVNQAGTVTSGLSQLQFNDGSSINLVQPLTFTWLGTGNNYFLTGSNYGSNVFDITAGSGTINFGNSSSGGDGRNTIKYIRGDATANVNLNGGTGTVAFGAGIASQDVYLQANTSGDLIVKIRNDAADTIFLHNDLTNNAGTVTSAVGQLQFNDGSSVNLGQPLTFTWLGDGNNYYLTGSNFGANTFEITAGNGNVFFGSGGNTIKYHTGTGYVDVALNGGTGTIEMGPGVAASNVVYQSNANGDLIINIVGDPSDYIIVRNDYSTASGTLTSGISRIQFSDGTTMSPLSLDFIAPTVSSVIASGSGITSGNGTLGAGGVVTLTVNFSENVVVTTTGGTPALTLNDGGTATYTGGSGTGALTFSYTVAAGQNTSDLTVTGLNLNGGTIADAAGNAAVVGGAAANPAGTLLIDTSAPTVSSVAASPASGTVFLGNVVTLTVNFNENVVVTTTGGTPTLTLNDGGTATYASGSGSSALAFSYTVAAGQSTSDLAVTALNLNGGSIKDGAGNAAVVTGAVTNPSGVLIVDGIAPTVNSVATSGAGITSGSGNLNAGKVVTLTVNFSESVAVVTTGGTPTLTLNDGGTATYTSGSGSSALTFTYTVAAGQNTPDLTVTALNLNGGTIKDVAGNTAVVTGAVTNPAGTLQIDTTASTVSSVASSGAGITSGSGTVGVGTVVTLTVNFDESVVVTTTGGTPTLTLNDGGTATYASGSGTNALAFNYTVAAGQNTPDLTITALNLNGGTIMDGAGNTAVVSGAATNPAGTLQIDTSAPTVSSVTTSPASGTVILGGVVTLTVNFSENVAVTGTPTLTLNDGGTATYTGGSGTGALAFSYTVAAGQNTADLTVTALNLNGGTIKDGAGNAAVVTGAATNPAGILLIDGTAPTVSSVTTSPASGTVIAGGVVTLTVNFSENVAVNTTGGTPTLMLSDGGTATYTGGSGSGALTFSHTVAAGQGTADLTVTALNLNGGTIADVAGNTAVVTGAVTNPAGVLVIDGVAPTVNSVAASGSGITSGSGVLNAGKAVTLTANFSENVTVVTTGGTPSLTLNDGGTATYASGSGTSALAFTYTVAAGQNTPDLTVTALNLNGGTIKDAAGNAAVVTGAATNPAGTLQIDTAASTVSSVATSGTGITSGSGTVGVGTVVTLTVTFNESVVVTTTGGTPTLTLNDGGAATYTGGTGTSALTFNYTVAAGQSTADLTVTALNLNGGTIKDVAGNTAVVTGAATNPAGILLVDGTAPTVSSVTTSPGSGSVILGSVVTLTVNFSESVVVTTTGGTPTLTLNDGGIATYTGGSGTGALAFSYTVAAGQNTSDLTVTALNLNGGTIKDAAGNAAVVTGAVTNPAGVLLVDGTVPTATSIAATGTGITSGNGNLNAGKVVTLTATLSETVTVTTAGGTPTLALSDGGTASYTGGSGTTALTFSHTVAAGQNTPDLTVTGLNLNGGTVKDAAGNTAVITGNPAGTLQIDTTASTVNSIATSGTGITSGNGVLNAGKVVTLTVNFSENVTVVTTGGTPMLTLNDGGTATYASGTGTSALAFNYTVAAGQNTPDLTVTALNLNGGTIKDGAGNTAVVTGAATNPAGTLQIDTAASTVSSVATSGTGITSGTGVLNAGKVVTLTVNFNENVVVTTTGGTPTLTLNDTGVATYTGGTGTSALTFNYTVAAGQNTADLTVTALNLNGGTIKDVAGNTAVVTGAVTNPAGTLQIDTTASTVSSVVTSGPGITAGNGNLGVGAVVTLTVNFNEATVVTTTGGTPTLTLNDGGVATYTGGSGTTAQAFSYTVAAGQNTPDLTVTALNLNGGTIKDVAGNTAVVTGAATNPAGTLTISTPVGPMAAPPGAQGFASAASSGPNIYTLSPSESATITPDYSSGTSNEFDFTGNVTDQNLWFLQSGNNLQIDIVGTKNQTTINGWFNGGNQASEEFTAGGLRLDNQISQLVQAMAAYSGSHAGFDPTASNVHQIPNDAALQNTVATAWHA